MTFVFCSKSPNLCVTITVDSWMLGFVYHVRGKEQKGTEMKKTDRLRMPAFSSYILEARKITTE